MKRTLILCNGGLKSAFLTSLAFREDPDKSLLLFYEHGQVSNEARHKAVSNLSNYYHCDAIHLEAPDTLNGCGTFFDILHTLLHTIPLARQYNCYRIYLGWSLSNWHDILHLYNKSTIAAFLSNVNTTLNLVQEIYSREHQTYYLEPIEFECPLYRLSDAQVVFLGSEYYVPWHLTHHCTKSIDHHCGMCDECHQRQLVFKEAHIEDTTPYLITTRKEKKHVHNDSRN